MQKLAVEYIDIVDLIAYERNARTHSGEQIEQICQSIKEFGFTNPVLVDEKNELIAGHGRTEAAKRLGMTEVPAIRLANLSETQKKALRIADNQLALNAGWDDDLLRLELEEIKTEDFDLDLLGFSLDELDAILTANEEGSAVDCEDGEVIEPPVDPVTKTGDIWTLGRHRLLCGDSTKALDVESLVGSKRVDLYLTDPPYNVAYEGGTKEKLTIQNDSMDDSSFYQFLTDAFSMAQTVMKPGASFYVWHSDSEGRNFRTACDANGLKVRQCLIWSKNSMVMGRQDYQWKHEPCLYGWKEGAAHNWYSDRKQTTVLEFDKPLRNAEHPTMKPVELFAYQIQNSTKKGDAVFDGFAGSGTTLIACENLGRQAFVMELDPRYCDVIIERWQDLTGLEAVRDDGKTFNDLI